MGPRTGGNSKLMQVSGSTLLPHPLPSTPMNPSSPAPSLPPSVHFGHTGRVCIVTGGAQGIGEACVRRFAVEGAKPVIVDVDDARGQALAAELGALYVRCDVGDKAQVDALVAQVLAAHGRIDVLVNNAGIFRAADFLEVTEADFDAVLRVNLKGSFLVGQAVARAMVASGGGSIVNVCSINGQVGGAGSFSYQASKGAVRMMTKAAAMQYVKDNIRVNSICPGLVMTPMAEEEGVESNNAFAAATPMGRGARPEEVSYGVLYLACDEASYVTGTELYIDGGYTAQ